MDSFHEWLDACRSLASSVGELASLALLGAVSYLLVVVRSLRTRVLANLTKSASGFAPARRKRAPREARSSSALPGASAASYPLPQTEVSSGIPEEIPLTPVERFVSSLEAEEQKLFEGTEQRRSSADRPHSVGGSAVERSPVGDGTHDAGPSAATGGILGAKPG